MAHLAQQIFVSRVKSFFPQHFNRSHVLDIGSMDINGNNRIFFHKCEYTGIDIGKGPNVDFVCRGHEWKASKLYDVIISTECGEHDQFYPQTIQNAIRLLRPGGLLIYTCATDGRPEHGTRTTTLGDSPFTGDYYKNLGVGDIQAIPGFNDAWAFYRFTIDQRCHDLRFWGIKQGQGILLEPNGWIFYRLFLKFHLRRFWQVIGQKVHRLFFE